MEYTKHYHLPQWVESDLILMEDFNKAMANIDDGLEAVKTESATSIDTLADSTSSRFATMSAAMAEAIGSGGKNCRIAWGSYTGTGSYGQNNPSSLELGFCPVALVMASAAQEYADPTGLPPGGPSSGIRPRFAGSMFCPHRRLRCCAHLSAPCSHPHSGGRGY